MAAAAKSNDKQAKSSTVQPGEAGHFWDHPPLTQYKMSKIMKILGRSVAVVPRDKIAK